MRHVFLLMAVAWVALAINWAAADSWAHAAVTAFAGAACYLAGEHYGREA